MGDDSSHRQRRNQPSQPLDIEKLARELGIEVAPDDHPFYQQPARIVVSALPTGRGRAGHGDVISGTEGNRRSDTGDYLDNLQAAGPLATDEERHRVAQHNAPLFAKARQDGVFREAMQRVRQKFSLLEKQAEESLLDQVEHAPDISSQERARASLRELYRRRRQEGRKASAAQGPEASNPASDVVSSPWERPTGLLRHVSGRGVHVEAERNPDEECGED